MDKKCSEINALVMFKGLNLPFSAMFIYDFSEKY